MYVCMYIYIYIYIYMTFLECHTTRAGGRPNFLEITRVLRLGKMGTTSKQQA